MSFFVVVFSESKCIRRYRYEGVNPSRCVRAHVCVCVMSDLESLAQPASLLTMTLSFVINPPLSDFSCVCVCVVLLPISLKHCVFGSVALLDWSSVTEIEW